jgi:hypothetical protein
MRLPWRRSKNTDAIAKLKDEVARLEKEVKSEQIRATFFMARLIYAFGDEALRMDTSQYMAAVAQVRTALDKAAFVQAAPITQVKQ